MQRETFSAINMATTDKKGTRDADRFYSIRYEIEFSQGIEVGPIKNSSVLNQGHEKYALWGKKTLENKLFKIFN